MVRLFTGITLPKEQKKILHKVTEGLSGVRLTPQAQQHLTLNFIGEVESSLFHKLREEFMAIPVEPFALHLQGVGLFPSRGRPRILWAGLSPCPSLFTLQQLLRQRLMDAGVSQEQQVFHPHITLARIKKISRQELFFFCSANQQLTSPRFQVTDFHLFSSKLTQKGAVHKLEQSFVLHRKETR